MDINTMISLLVYICIVGAICGLLWWAIAALGIPEPFSRVARGVVIVFAVLFLISLLLSLVGHPIGVVPLRMK